MRALKSRRSPKAVSAPRTDEPTACRTRPRQSARKRRRTQRSESLFRFVPKGNAHKGADGLPPIIRASSISIAASADNGIQFAAGCKTTAEIAIQTLYRVGLQTKILP